MVSQVRARVPFKGPLTGFTGAVPFLGLRDRAPRMLKHQQPLIP